MEIAVNVRDLDHKYQTSLEGVIEDKMIFKSIIFDNQVIMITLFLDILKSLVADKLEEVDYEGSTSSIHLTVKEPMDIYKLLKESLINTIAMINPCAEMRECIGSTLIRRKLSMHPELGIVNACEWLNSLCISDSILSFFKVLDMGNNTYTIII